MLHRKDLATAATVVSLAISLVAATALALSLTPTGAHALRTLAAAAGSRIFPWAPVVALADTTCAPPTTSGGGTPPPTTSGGGTPPPTTSGGGICPPPPLGVVTSQTAAAVCQGSSTVLTAITSGGSLPITLRWSPSTGLSSTTGSTVTASPTTTTAYTVIATDSTGTSASSTTTVTVNPLPSVSISGAPAGPVIVGTVVILTANPGGLAYAWTKNGAAAGSGATLTADTTTAALGDRTYGLTATNANGCSGSASPVTVGVFDFTVSLSPANVTVLAGTPAAYSVDAAFVLGSHTAGAPSSLSLGITGAPAGSTVVAPASISLPSAGNAVTVTPMAAGPLGNFTILASGTTVSGTTRMSSGAGLHVYDFALAVAPATQTVTVGGGPAAYTVSAALLPGSTAIGLPASVGLAVIGLPGTVTPTFPSSVAFGASVPVSLAIGSTPPGDYPFTVIGAVSGGGRTAMGDLKIAYNICFLYDQTQVHQLGSTIPIKLQLCDNSGANLSSSGIVVHAIFLQLMSGTPTGLAVMDSGNANPDNDFRFDPTIGTTGGYIFNLSTKNLPASGIWALVFQAGTDPTFHQALFQIK